MNNQFNTGFTLIELIIVIVIVGILSTITTDIIIQPINSYITLERRTTLVDSADMALRRMQRDIRRALPNSIRITHAGKAIELLHIADGGRYRATLASDGTGDIVNINRADNHFDVMGALARVPKGQLVIYNLGSGLANAYVGNNRAIILNSSTVNSITLKHATLFPFQSPEQRFFIIDTPISYHCNNGELRRYDNTIDTRYKIKEAAPVLATLKHKLQLRVKKLDCVFSYDSAASKRAGLVTLEIAVADKSGESIRLIQQVHVDNMP